MANATRFGLIFLCASAAMSAFGCAEGPDALEEDLAQGDTAPDATLPDANVSPTNSFGQPDASVSSSSSNSSSSSYYDASTSSSSNSSSSKPDAAAPSDPFAGIISGLTGLLGGNTMKDAGTP